MNLKHFDSGLLERTETNGLYDVSEWKKGENSRLLVRNNTEWNEHVRILSIKHSLRRMPPKQDTQLLVSTSETVLWWPQFMQLCDIINFCISCTVSLKVRYNVTISLVFLTAWRCASAIYAIALCQCLYVCHKSEFYRNCRTSRSWFWRGSFLRPILQCVIKKFGYLQK